MSDHDQLQERHEKLAQRAHNAEAQLGELRAKFKHLERDRDALLAQVRELRGVGAAKVKS